MHTTGVKAESTQDKVKTIKYGHHLKIVNRFKTLPKDKILPTFLKIYIGLRNKKVIKNRE